MKKLNELQEKVLQWSKDRGITINGKSTTQTLKLIAEFGEIFEAILVDTLENNREKSLKMYKDAIGDNLVVLINLSELLKKEAKENNIKLEKTFDWSYKNKNVPYIIGTSVFDLLTINYGQLADAVAKQNYNKALDLINESLKYLNFLAEQAKTSLEKCLEHAYNDIKDRKGFLNENGNFIKNTDPNYEKLYKEFLERQK